MYTDHMDERPRCTATRRDGTPCVAPASGDSGMCIGHGPHSTNDTRKNGGHARSNGARATALLPPRLRPVLERLERTLEGLESGEVDPRRATAMASLTGAIVKVMQASDLEERLREVEAVLAPRMEERERHRQLPRGRR